MRFVLAGQPNSGKSTIFNSVAGYRSATANFPGSSVTFFTSRALILGREVEVVDLPGIYSLTSSDTRPRARRRRYLLDEPYDLIINVVDASRLGRSLELTLQLLELERPMIVALNMMDEADGAESRSTTSASRQLGVPVVETIARLGRGLKRLFRRALQLRPLRRDRLAIDLDREVEEAIGQVVVDPRRRVTSIPGCPRGWWPTSCSRRDPHVEARVYGSHPELEAQVAEVGRDGSKRRTAGAPTRWSRAAVTPSPTQSKRMR